jgi:large subunit ribosomal protein L29
MDIDKVRALTDGELEDQLKEAKQDLWQARFQLNTRQLKDYSSIPQTRRAIARILTVQRERLDGQVEEVEPAAELQEETEGTSTAKPRRIARILQRERRVEPAEEVEETVSDELDAEPEAASQPTGGDEEITR